MTRLIRILLLALVPAIAVAVTTAGCGDDTSVAPPNDMSMIIRDMAKPVDMAKHD